MALPHGTVQKHERVIVRRLLMLEYYLMALSLQLYIA